jgi:hypothetical protein
MTAAQAVAALVAAIDYGRNAMRNVYGPSARPGYGPNMPVNPLVAAIDDAYRLQQAFDVFVKKGAGDSYRVSRGNKLWEETAKHGAMVFVAANGELHRANQPIQLLPDVMPSWLKGVLIVGGIFATASALREVASTARAIKTTVRGYGPQRSIG